MIEKTAQHHNSAAGFAAFLVICLFLFMFLTLLVLGAGVYNKIITQGQENSRIRIFANYIARKLRCADSAENVFTEEKENGTVLIIRRVYDTQTYLTRIYCQNGYLMEMMTEEEAVFCPEFGEKIWNAQAFTVSSENQAYVITIITENGKAFTSYAAMN